MSTDNANNAKRFGEYVRGRTRSEDRNRHKSRLHESLEAANKAVSRGYVAEAGEILRNVVLPTLDRLDYVKPIQHYHGPIAADDDLPWHWPALKRFLNDPDSLITAADAGRSGESARETIIQTLESIESISTHIGVTSRSLRNKVDVMGFSLKTGEHLQDFEMDIGDPVKGVTLQSGSLKTLFTGGTGNGKSTGVEAEVEDYYQSNFRDDKPDFKILDLVGLRDGENWFYDIPQKQRHLKRIRREMGLPETFDDSDELQRPSMEILVPLTPGLSRQELPFDTDSEEFVVRPFVVPASEIEKTAMVSYVACRLSDGQEETIRSAYEAVDREQDDWSLKDLAEEIQNRDELPPNNKATAVNVIQSLQDKGFIRTKQHEHCLDWREIFADTETITVFSQAFCESAVARYTVLAYLLQAIGDKRERMHDIPQCVMVLRELWKVTPHKQRRSGYKEVEALQESIVSVFTGIMRENRHGGIHVVADTQDPSDLEKAVREMFNRYVVYNGNDDTIKDIFSWTYNSRYRGFMNTLSAKAGEAGIVGMVEPAVKHRHIEFLSPVRFAPPSHHHRVSPSDDPSTVGVAPDVTGWHGRVRHHDHEELRRPCDADGVEWDDELPDELTIKRAAADNDRPDPESSPVAAFADRCMVPADISAYAIKQDVYDAFNEFLVKHKKERWDFNERARQTTFGERIRKSFDDIESRSREGQQAFVGVALSTEGQSLLDSTRNDVQSSASTILGDD